MWKKYEYRGERGLLVDGDPDAPELRCWNYLFLLLFGWKQAYLLKVNTSKPFRLGYVMSDGRSFVHRKPFYDNFVRFCVRRGACSIFAIDLDGKHISLSVERVVDRNDRTYGDIQII